ncbi:DEAD/DEAH box helicase [Arthrobacter zhaoxinii]|uniref:DEAD/DEAH box helicase n=1 Tax=Arthrobacter zhaoxinii TaxID=2964616 RepID=UPI0021021F9C|nr:DEAD/DEAH box helicase [Arthrobacter zhaoxinii]MCQ2002221.1 DEAD/DEAH box helicase [Arthrobacter zhaoxinii]
MARDAQGLGEELSAATDPSFRGRLLARGQAQSMIRRDGALPSGSPEFSAFLDGDLLNYGYALLSDGLDLLEQLDSDENDGTSSQAEVARFAFIQSSYALESATRNSAGTSDKMFHRLIAGAASHLGGYAARAFSLVEGSQESGQLTPMERTLADLIMRDLSAIEERTRLFRSFEGVSDESLLATLSEDDANEVGAFGPITLLLSEHYLSAVAKGIFAIEVENRELLNTAVQDMILGERASMDASVPGPWWVYRLTRRIVGDLFRTSIGSNIPVDFPDGAASGTIRWRYLRSTFIENLLSRRRSEIDLWPSQLNVVNHIFANGRDLVVALPTSAGKTRIAELSILAALARGRRTIYVTPLRALSAQTEQILTRTFSALGVRVSSLYGSAGISDVDGDALRLSEIVVATPEKLDFALRSDPSVLDDVGLIVLDEGHMIGASEREIRYEAQIQRLLRRSDAANRRIICLSAVFPSGTDLHDFVAWITNDDPEGLHQESWRPTLQRFGLIEWQSSHARLSITLGADQPHIPRYFEAAPPTGRRRRQFPANQRELVIATAWRLVEEGQTVLVFCPQRNSVEPYARTIIDLHRQGLVPTLLPDHVDLREALVVGAEWFGDDHPILQCLGLGVAVHHGALPGPFRREVEKLLHDGKLKVTIASPTLAQGLNLSASCVLFHSLRRGRDLLKSSDFSNVIGRAGRAFIDTEGLVLYPIFEQDRRRRNNLRRDWGQLTQGGGGKALDSGLIQIGIALIRRMLASSGSHRIETFLDYLTGGPDWNLPILERESTEDQLTAESEWRENLSLLDIGILSTIGDGAYDSDPAAAIQILTDALVDSLWERQLRRGDSDTAAAIRQLIMSRVRHLWVISTPSQRRGWYLAGLGADAGSKLSEISGHVVNLLNQIDTDLLEDNLDAASNHLVEVAGAIFSLAIFTPDDLIGNWHDVLRLWVQGQSLANLTGDHVKIAQFIESGVVYKLVWGMEAARVFETAQGNILADTLSGAAATAVETGTFNWSASVLIRSGFDHRLAAVNAVVSTGADFYSGAEMRQWIDGLDPAYASDTAWPSPESRRAWEEFTSHARQLTYRQWKRTVANLEEVRWIGEVPVQNAWLRVSALDANTIQIWTPGFDLLGEASVRLNPDRLGILRAQRTTSSHGIRLIYRGPRDLYAPVGPNT